MQLLALRVLYATALACSGCASLATKAQSCAGGHNSGIAWASTPRLLQRIEVRKDGLDVNAAEYIITESIRHQTRDLQAWLEDLYDSVDYEAALKRADGEGVSTAEARENDLEGNELSDGVEGELTYGEMDLSFFVALMAAVEPAIPSVFLDVGCGRGQLVLAAARTGRWERCVGIEIEKTVLEIGRGALQLAQDSAPSQSQPDANPFHKGRCELKQSDMYLEREAYAKADVVFAYATCFATSDGVTLTRLSAALAAALRPGCHVITVNKRLHPPHGFALRGVFVGPNPDSVHAPAHAYLWHFHPRDVPV